MDIIAFYERLQKKLLFEEIYRYKNKNIVIPDLYLKQMQSLKNKDILTIQSNSGYKTQYELEVIGEVDALSNDTLYMYCKSGSQYYCINFIMTQNLDKIENINKCIRKIEKAVDNVLIIQYDEFTN